LLDPPSTLSPGDAVTEVPGRFVDDVLLNLYARTHRTTNQSDGEDSEGALEGDLVEDSDPDPDPDPDPVDHRADDFWNGEDVASEGDVDPREGVLSDWDLLTEEFIVKAEELSKFEHSLLRAP
jgi:hypothetical protein